MGQNWALVNATIGNDLVLLNADSANAQITQSNLGSTNSTAKLITFTTLSSSDEVSQILRISQNIAGSGVNIYTDDNGVNLSAIGVHKVTIPKDTSANDILFVRLNSGANRVVSLSNFSVIEITTDTNLPRINYEGFSYQDALGSELVTNGGFDTDSDWIKVSGVTISDGKANAAFGSSGNILRQSLVTFDANKTYKYEFTISNYVSGNLKFASFIGAINESGNGTYVGYGKPNGTGVNNMILFGSFEGSIDNVSVKEYLGQEVVPDSGCGSWLWEPQSTNLIEYSEDLSTYSTTDVTVSATTEKSPINSVTPFLITEIATTDQHYIGGNSISLSGNNTISCFVKNVSLGRYFKVWGFGLGSANEAVIFDTNTETIYEPPTSNVYVGGSAKLEDYGNGWFRCSITINITTTSFLAVGLINTVTAFGNNTYTGDITKSVLITGIQVEQQSYATSYIPTSGSSVTRNQDLCTNGGSLASINSTEGVLYAEIAALANDGTTRFLGLNDGSNSNRVVILYFSSTNKIRAIVSSGGTKYVDINYQLTNILDFHKVAIKYKLNDFAFWIDGVEVATDTSLNAPIGLDRLDFLLAGANNFFGKTKALAVFPYLSDQELTALTTI